MAGREGYKRGAEPLTLISESEQEHNSVESLTHSLTHIQNESLLLPSISKVLLWEVNQFIHKYKHAHTLIFPLIGRLKQKN